MRPPWHREGRGKSRSSERSRPQVILVPGDRPLEALAELRSGREAELLPRPGRIQAASGLAVGLGRVPADLAFEARKLGYQRDEIADADLHARPQVHRIGFVVALRRQDDALGGILGVQELSRGQTVAPDLDVGGVRRLGVHALLDQRRNDVARARVKGVSRAIKVHGQQVDRIDAILLAWPERELLKAGGTARRYARLGQRKAIPVFG